MKKYFSIIKHDIDTILNTQQYLLSFNHCRSLILTFIKKSESYTSFNNDSNKYYIKVMNLIIEI